MRNAIIDESINDIPLNHCQGQAPEKVPCWLLNVECVLNVQEQRI